MEDRSRKPKHFEVLGKKGAEFEELHIELDGGVRKTRHVSRTITNGNPKWSSKAHLMNAETDRPA